MLSFCANTVWALTRFGQRFWCSGFGCLRFNFYSGGSSIASRGVVASQKSLCSVVQAPLRCCWSYHLGKAPSLLRFNFFSEKLPLLPDPSPKNDPNQNPLRTLCKGSLCVVILRQYCLGFDAIRATFWCSGFGSLRFNFYSGGVCVLTWLPARGGRLATRVCRDAPRAPPA